MNLPVSNSASVRRSSAGRYALSGEATLETVGALRAAGRQAFATESGPVVVDLAGVTRADSAGLAMLIDWLAWARAAQRALSYESIPTTLIALARLSDVVELLGEAPAATAAASSPAADTSVASHQGTGGSTG